MTAFGISGVQIVDSIIRVNLVNSLPLLHKGLHLKVIPEAFGVFALQISLYLKSSLF
jgi:F0F1-type ATP synthase membrane subunit c/vacuolar-type H+-ATPase subunit K